MKYFRFVIGLLILLIIKSNIYIAKPLDLVNNVKKQNESIAIERVNDIEIKNKIIEEEKRATISEPLNTVKRENIENKEQKILAYSHEIARGTKHEYCLFYVDEKLYKEFNDLEKGCYYARYYDDFDDAIDVVFYDGKDEWHVIYEKDFPSDNIIKHGDEGERNIYLPCDIEEALDTLRKVEDKNLIELLEVNENSRKKSPLYIVEKLRDEGFMNSDMSIQETKVYVAFYMYGRLEYPKGFISANEVKNWSSLKREEDYKISCYIDYDYKSGNYTIKDDVEIVDNKGIKKVCKAEAVINFKKKLIEKFKVY